MIIIRENIYNGFTKVDKRVFIHRGLSEGAKVLYGYLVGLQTGSNYSDTYMSIQLDITSRTLTKRKKELKDAGLILVKQISPRSYLLFVGTTKKPASIVYQEWQKLNIHEDD